MKVKGPGGVSQTSKSKAKTRTGAGESGFADNLKTEGTTGASNVAGSVPVAAVDALLSYQEVPDAAGGRSKGLVHGQDMLDHLEQVRRDLLLGAIPKARLKALSSMIKNRRDQFDEPGLSDVLDAIELRARVELAKFEAGS